MMVSSRGNNAESDDDNGCKLQSEIAKMKRDLNALELDVFDGSCSSDEIEDDIGDPQNVDSDDISLSQGMVDSDNESSLGTTPSPSLCNGSGSDSDLSKSDHGINSNQIKMKTVINDGEDDKFKNGEKYILVDAGGGVVDISYHTFLEKYEDTDICHIKEIHRPSGGPWGSCYIDDKYVELLKIIFGGGLIDEFKKLHPNIFVELVRDFQDAKCGFDEKAETHFCRLPTEFVWFMDEQLGKNDNLYHLEDMVEQTQIIGKTNLVALQDQYLVIHKLVWIWMFDHVINPIIKHIKKNVLNETLMNCKYLFLIGGLSCSPYFQSKMRMEFGAMSDYKLSIIIPPKPMLSVVEGAAYFGIIKNYVKGRVLQRTYGHIVNLAEYAAKSANISEEYIKKNRYYDKWRKKYYVQDCFLVLARKNQQIISGFTKKCKASRKSPTSKKIKKRIYCSDKEYPLTPSDCDQMATMRLIWDNNDVNDMNLITEFNFNDTTIKVESYKKSTPNNKQRVQLNYF